MSKIARCHHILHLQCVIKLVRLKTGIETQSMANADGSLHIVTRVETQIVLFVVPAVRPVCKGTNPSSLRVEHSLSPFIEWYKTSTTALSPEVLVQNRSFLFQAHVQ